MQIRVIAITKKNIDIYRNIINSISKNILQFAHIEYIPIMDNDIINAQNQNTKNVQNVTKVQKIYAKKLNKFKKGYNIALDINAKEHNSHSFSNLIANKTNISFFVGGAYGLQKEFVRSCECSISMSKMTFGHKMAIIMLYEQIFRAMSIINNHPYHK